MPQSPLHDEDKKMIKILACKKLRLHTSVQNVYNGIHIYNGVKKYIYIHEKVVGGDTWLINVLGCDVFGHVKETLYTLDFYHCHCCVRGPDFGPNYRPHFERYDLKLFVNNCMLKFRKAETVIAFTAENGFLYSLSFINELKCRVSQWRAIMDY
jgi:hypothetical protein